MLWLDPPTAAQNSSRADLIRGLSAGALGLIGTVATLLYGWIRDRDTIATRTKQLDEATRRVAFWKSWHEAISPLDSGSDSDYWRERARTEMWYASVTIEELFRRQAPQPFVGSERDIYVRGLPGWRRWFLFYKPARSRAWIPRVIFYLYFFAAPFSIPLQFRFQSEQRERYLEYQKQRLEDLNAQPSIDPAIVEERARVRENIAYGRIHKPKAEFLIISYVVGALFAMAFSLLFRSWSLRLDKPVVPLLPIPLAIGIEQINLPTKQKRSFWWPLR